MTHRPPRTREVEFARDGMYYKEFPVMFDWLHNGEGLTVFNLPEHAACIIWLIRGVG